MPRPAAGLRLGAVLAPATSIVYRGAAAALLLAPVAGRIHSLVISNDPRFVFSIEAFGFYPGGKIELTVSGLSAAPRDAPGGHQLGFVMYPTENVASVDANVKYLDAAKLCALEAAPQGALVINMTADRWARFSTNAEISGGGMFDLLFTHCSPIAPESALGGGAGGGGGLGGGAEPVTASFTLDAVFVNPGGNYLSAGDMPLPAVLGAMCLLFAAAAGFWVWWLRRNAADVHRVHHLMTLLICVKTFQLCFEALMYHYISLTGHNSAWNTMFYIFSILKTGIMVLVAVLVATGWSIMRPFLTQREKNVLAVALGLQLLANTAIIITDEIAPGSLSYLEWTDVFHIADFIAAVAIIAPVHWSLKQLQQTYQSGAGADTDAKAAETLARLTVLRSFYLWTICYVYATRLLLWILAQGLSYRYTWLAPFLEEAVTFSYYAYTGYRFRPSSENAYLRVTQDDDDGGGGSSGNASAGGDGAASTQGARATGAAAGAVEGSSSAVQTIEVARRAASDGATAPALAAAKGVHAHVVGDEEDDDDFDLDNLDDDETSALSSGGPVGVKNLRAKS